MAKFLLKRPVGIWEILFQVIIYFMVFIFYSFERIEDQVEVDIIPAEIVFFLNYAVVALFISYWVAPRYLYTKRYLQFGLWIVGLLTLVIILEELVIEKIYYPDTRGSNFPGIFYSLAAILPTIVILSGFKFTWDALRKQQEVDQLKDLVKQSELQYLKSQINPHFLFNNLNNLYAYAIENSTRTPKIILELSNVLRYMLYDCKAHFVLLSKEIDHLADYINLNKLQLEGRALVDFEVSENIDLQQQIAPLILPVFIENAFKHSSSSLKDNIKIHVSIASQDGVLNFKCSNSFSEQTNTNSLAQGIGLENVKKRLDLIYGIDYSLTIDKGAQLFVVQLTMKLKS